MSETLHIHGPGRTGASLAIAARAAGVAVGALSGGDASKRAAVVARIGTQRLQKSGTNSASSA